ncbi:MAG TPA: hypothetical protein VIK72_03715 [Clostridiaceae bacterium]
MILDDYYNYIYKMDFNELNNRFKYLGAGSSRAVYEISTDCVGKFSFNKGGDSQCSLENHIFNNCRAYFREYLCPIIWYKKGMVIMKKAEPLGNIDYNMDLNLERIGRGENVRRDMRALARKYDLLYGDLLAPSSWGFIREKLYLIDYGCKD